MGTNGAWVIDLIPTNILSIYLQRWIKDKDVFTSLCLATLYMEFTLSFKKVDRITINTYPLQ